MTDETKAQSRMVVQSKSVGPKWEQQFFLEVQAAILDGWRIADNGLRADTSMRNFRGKFGRVVFFKDTADVAKGDFMDDLSMVKDEAKPSSRPSKVKDAPKPKAPKKKTTKPKADSE